MPQFAANLSMMFTDVPFLERFALAATAGFRGVEFLFPYQEKAEMLQQLLQQHHLTQVLFNLPPGDWAAGERGIAALPGREEEFKAGVELALRYAKTLGCQQLHVMAGLRHAAFTEEQQRQCYISNVRYAAEKLAPHQIKLLIEPINSRDMPGYLLNTQQQAEEYLTLINCPNLFIQLDLYHCQIMEGDLLRTIQRLWGKFAHMQIASVPHRHEPDEGEINYPWLFNQLDQLGYQGWIGCEYHPKTTTEQGLSWFKPWRYQIEQGER